MRREGKKLGLRSNRSMKKSAKDFQLNETIIKSGSSSTDKKIPQVDDLQYNIPYSLNKKKRWQLADQIKQLEDEMENSESEDEMLKTDNNMESTSKPRTRKERRELEKKAHEAKQYSSKNKNSKWHKETHYKTGHVIVENGLHWNIKTRNFHFQEEIDDGQDIYEIEKIPRASYPMYSGSRAPNYDSLQDMVGFGRTPEKSKWKGKGIKNKQSERHVFYNSLSRMFQ